ncbi:MAG: CHASE3 domain-containing protein [Gemmataceae bacterium]
MERAFDVGIAAGFGLLAALIVVNAGLGYRNTRQLHEDASQVAHTHEVLDALGDLLSSVKDAETGQRGFLITGVRRYLKPYNDAVAVVPQKMERVLRLTEDNLFQQERIPALQKLVQAKLDELTRTIDLREKLGFEAARQAVLTDEGKASMDSLRSWISDMVEEERGLLRSRQQANDRAYGIAVATGAVGGMVGVTAAAAFFWTLRRHLAARARAAALVHEQLRLILAHELRNPLTAIRSTVQLWQRLPDTARTPSSLEAVVGAVDRLNALVSRLLPFSRPADQREHVDLNVVLSETLDLLQAQAARQGVSMQCRLAPDLPLVLGSAGLLHQVALNLLTNALQVMPHGGQLRCSTRHDLAAGEVEFRISDTGPGVAAEDRPHLFELFFTTRAEGTGLGLAICREIVASHGGRIGLDEGTDAGATFVVSLPAH